MDRTPVMGRMPNENTLFHLVPRNEAARDVLKISQNLQFVSRITFTSANGTIQRDGLEIGFHVPAIPNSRVITTLGRQGDLVFRNNTISKNHAAFEFYPQTKEIVLCVQSTNYSGVKVRMLDGSEAIIGDCPLVYGTPCEIYIGPCAFALTWILRGPDAAVRMEQFTWTCYSTAMVRANCLNVFNRPTVINSSEHRLLHPPSPKVIGSKAHELRHLRRPLGFGAYGAVYATVDAVSRQFMAVKEIRLDLYDKEGSEGIRDDAMAEIKALQTFRHVSSLYPPRMTDLFRRNSRSNSVNSPILSNSSDAIPRTLPTSAFTCLYGAAL